MDKSSPDYLLQNLNNVYGYADNRTYPMSSYSYAIIPTASNDSTMTTAKRQTLADYLYLSICAGQQQMGPIGYSPLPINLVEASFQQMNLLHTADSKVVLGNENVTTCNNPTFIAGKPTVNHLAQIAPQPPACDKQGAGPCTGAVDTGQHNPTGTKTGSGNGTTAPGGGTPSGGSSSGGPTPIVGASGSDAPSGGTSTDPNTGQVVSNCGDCNGGDSGPVAAGTSTELAKTQSPSEEIALGILAGLMLIGLLIVPPLLGRYLDGRAKG
jgi:hypothetical protein